MKFLALISTFFLAFNINLNAQAEMLLSTANKDVSYTGGMDTFVQDLLLQLDKNGTDYHDEVGSILNVKFTIKADGSITDVFIFNDIDPKLEQAITLAIKQLTKWNPAVQAGKKVDREVYLPIELKIALASQQ